MSKRIALGKLAGGSYGLRVAKAGMDVSLNPPDPTQLIFDSAWPRTLPIHQRGTFTFARDQTGSVSFPQLPFTPMFTAFSRQTPSTTANISGWDKNWVAERQLNTQIAYTSAGDGTAVFRIWCTSSGIFACTHYANGQYPSAPGYIDIAYVIYKTGVVVPS